MKTIGSNILTCILLLGCGPVFASGIPDYRPQSETKFNRTTVVRVLLDSAQSQVRLSALNKKMRVQESPVPNWKPIQSNVLVDLVERDGKTQMRLNGDALTTTKISFRPSAGISSELRYQAGIYRGDLVVHLVDKKLIVVNEIPIEDYLIGILPGEMSPGWEIAALRAQAVASRTYALYMVAHPKTAQYDVERNVRDQVYTGAQLETSKIRDAVRSTEGELLKKDNRLVKIFFHARCGGHTESPSVVWKMPSNASFRRVACEYCQQNPFRWQAAISRDEIRSALGIADSGFKMMPSVTSPTGRIQSIRIALNNRGTQASREVSSDELRGLIGYARLKSAQFEWEPTQQGFLFRGVGNGHGVGMCQWGAQHLARQGKSYRDILAYYYPNFSLSKDRSYTAFQ